MYFSMIQDKVDFKSKWMPVTEDWEGARAASVTEGMRFSTVFIETASGEQVCRLRAVIPSQERGCVSGFLRLSRAEPRVLSLKYKDFPW